MPKLLERALLLVLTTPAVVAGLLVNLVAFCFVIDVVSPYWSEQCITFPYPDGRPMLRTEALHSWPGLTGLDTTVPHGRSRAWHEDGRPSAFGLYVDGEREGPWMRWHPNGLRASHGSFRRGVRVGLWEHWREDGSLDEERTRLYPDDPPRE